LIYNISIKEEPVGSVIEDEIGNVSINSDSPDMVQDSDNCIIENIEIEMERDIKYQAISPSNYEYVRTHNREQNLLKKALFFLSMIYHIVT
jgi:hypothetical protein